MPDTIKPFQAVQLEFTAHLRDPAAHAAPADIEDRRLEIYRGLLYRNVENFISSAFPVTRQLYSDQHWQMLVRNFFAHHVSHSPYFKDISKEFLDFLNNEYSMQPHDPAFLLELTHYEWLEISLTFMDEDIDWKTIDKHGNLLEQVPMLSPLLHLNQYQFPVHQVSREFQPQTAPSQPTFILVYRDQQDKVGFMEMNPMTASLVHHLAENHEQLTGKEILQKIAAQLPSLSLQAVLHGGHSILNQLHDKDIVLGTQAAM